MKIWIFLRDLIKHSKQTLKRFFEAFYIPLKYSAFFSSLYIIIKIICSLVPIVTVISLQNLIDSISYANFTNIFLYAFLMVFLNAFEWIVENIDSQIAERIKLDISAPVIMSINEKKNSICMAYFEDDESCKLMYRVSSSACDKITSTFLSCVGLIELIIQLLSLLLIISSYVWWSSIVIIVLSIPLLYFSKSFGEDSYESDIESTDYKRKSDYYFDLLTKKETIYEKYLFNSSGFLMDKWKNDYHMYEKLKNQQQLKSFIKTKFSGIIVDSATLLIIFFMIILLLQNTISFSLFVSYSSAVFGIISIVSWNLTYFISEVYTGLRFNEEYHLFFDMEEERSSGDIITEIQTIEFKNVSFSYPNSDKYVINNLSLKLEKGKKYFLVGRNGSGKSTFTKLILGVYDNYDGEIFINGCNLKKINLKKYRNKISYLNQVNMKLNTKVSEYIFDNPDNLVDNSKLVKLDKMLKENFNQKINRNNFLGNIFDKGIVLSDGEWQQLNCIKQLLNNKDFYIFDEPTSFADPNKEKQMYEYFSNNFNDKIFILISHRMSFGKISDEIIVLSDGKMIECGNYEGLLAKDGAYSKMYRIQQGWYK